jgi:hypothetical protein
MSYKNEINTIYHRTTRKLINLPSLHSKHIDIKLILMVSPGHNVSNV